MNTGVAIIFFIAISVLLKLNSSIYSCNCYIKGDKKKSKEISGPEGVILIVLRYTNIGIVIFPPL